MEVHKSGMGGEVGSGDRSATGGQGKWFWEKGKVQSKARRWEVWGGRVEYGPGEGSEDEGEVGLVSGVLGGGVFCWADGDIREARGREGKAGRKEERKGERARGIISTNSRSTAKQRFTCLPDLVRDF